MKEYIFTIRYDEEAGVYLGSCPEVRGLHVEGATIESVFEVIEDALPDFIADNLAYDAKQGYVPLYNIVNYAQDRTLS